ncbi:S49 family peptidase [Isobaculum melis]|uniref:Protease-4 n=1 Tax=Isobaculum melis TaxID=142588 RepID=A0A1H9RJG4_9LACT|nr:S49 family peptidase [Isobaculum melis]SER72981.1 protease-4 [Isobaculum melis]
MSQKRWLAIVLAIAIFVFSFVSIETVKNVVSAIQGDKAAATALLDQFDNQDEALTEQIIHKGNSKKRIVILNIDGTIVNNPQSATNGYDHEIILEELTAIKKDQTIGGVLLVLNSPGGGAYESNQVRERLLEIQKTQAIPIYVAMKNIATGGSYFIATSGDKLFASNETITGFIQATMKNADSPNKEVVQKTTNDSYLRFLDIVSQSREIPKDKITALADGRIFNGNEAKKNGLIDEIGNEQDALAVLMNDHQLEDAEVFMYQPSNPTVSNMMTDKMLQILQLKNEQEQQPNVSDIPQMMYLYGGE